MIKFNDNNVISGFIKQLLHSFNLPNVRVYKDDLWVYAKENDSLFLKNSQIVQVSKKQIDSNGNKKILFKQISPYTFNSKINNLTTNLKINNLIYDSHTHEYLGNYLRFIRDYKNLNLMSMYNCFSNSLVNDNDALTLLEALNPELIKDVPYISDRNYKVYSFPVRLNQKYTISIASGVPYEIFCAFYSKGYVDKRLKITSEEEIFEIPFIQLTYQKIPGSSFSKPFTYDKLFDLGYETTENEVQNVSDLLTNENCLRMFIKIPTTNTSSIVVLEGDYTTNNNWTFSGDNCNWEQVEGETQLGIPNNSEIQITRNRSITNIADKDSNININDIKLISALQLQYLNSGTSYPFADKLLEYLSNNAIDNTETISDNIKRTQKELLKNYKYEIISKKEGENPEVIDKAGILHYEHAGVWEDKYRDVLYKIAKQEKIINNKFDVLGYVDKDLEEKLIRNLSEEDMYE